MNLRRGRLYGWLAASLPLAGFLAIPLLALALSSYRNRVPISADFLQAIFLSFKTSLLSLAITVICGTPLALVLARGRFRTRPLLSALVDLPIALPPAAAGIALLLAFGRNGLVSTSLGFTTGAVVAAQTFVSCPFFIRAATSAFESADQHAEESAELDGAGPLTVFFRILVSQTSPQLISGAVTSWARALGEFGATILFAGNLVGKTQTMPLAIYLGFESDFDQAVMLSVVLLGIAFFTILAVRLLTFQGRASKIGE